MPVLVETFELLIVWFRSFAVGVWLCAVMALGGICSPLACRVPLLDAVLMAKTLAVRKLLVLGSC